MGKFSRIPSYVRKPFLIYDFATAPLWISLYSVYEENLIYFLSVQGAREMRLGRYLRILDGDFYVQYIATVQYV